MKPNIESSIKLLLVCEHLKIDALDPSQNSGLLQEKQTYFLTYHCVCCGGFFEVFSEGGGVFFFGYVFV